jgi:hypothetical protein
MLNLAHRTTRSFQTEGTLPTNAWSTPSPEIQKLTRQGLAILLAASLFLIGCKGTLTPEELAKRHPGGTPFTADEQRELQALSPREYRAFMQKYQTVSQQALFAQEKARGASLASVRDQTQDQDRATEIDALLTTARTISASEKPFVGSWKLTTKGSFISEGPITLTITLKRNGLGSGALVDKFAPSKDKDRSTKGRLAWSFDGDQLRLVIEHGLDQTMKARRQGQQLVVTDEDPPVAFSKQ